MLEFCIVIYCLDKNIVLFGEKLFLNFIDGVDCDYREDFVRFLMCCVIMVVYINIELGCSIGRDEINDVGFVGFLVEIVRNECGFFIVVYVVILNFYKLYIYKVLLLDIFYFNDIEYVIVYLLFYDVLRVN